MHLLVLCPHENLSHKTESTFCGHGKLRHNGGMYDSESGREREKWHLAWCWTLVSISGDPLVVPE
jgi:hypothetical protein